MYAVPRGFIPTHATAAAPASLFARIDLWLARQFDAMAERRDAQASAALMAALDDRILADIGYGAEDAFRKGHA
jgi:hypothetical protein